MEKGYTHDVTFEKDTEFGCWYYILVDGKRVHGAIIERKPNKKFAICDWTEKDDPYFGVTDGTLKECKEYCKENWGYGF